MYGIGDRSAASNRIWQGLQVEVSLAVTDGEKGDTNIWWTEARNAAKPPRTSRTAP